MKTESEIRLAIKDVLAGMVTDDDTYDTGRNVGYLHALDWVLGEDEPWVTSHA